MNFAEEIVSILTDRKETLSIAESLTGGALTSAIVDVSGASHILKGSIIAYSIDIKVRELSVPQETIDRSGVVSEVVALKMAEGIRSKRPRRMVYCRATH